MINSHQIQNLERQLSQIKEENKAIVIRYGKSERVTELLAKVVYQLEDQVQSQFAKLTDKMKNQEKK